MTVQARERRTLTGNEKVQYNRWEKENRRKENNNKVTKGTKPLMSMERDRKAEEGVLAIRSAASDIDRSKKTRRVFSGKSPVKSQKQTT